MTSLTNSLEVSGVKLLHSSLEMLILRYSAHSLKFHDLLGEFVAEAGIILQNISDIAELGLDNPEIYENLLNALEEMGGDDEDSEVTFRLFVICYSQINFPG